MAPERPWWEKVSLSSPEQTTLRERCQHLLEPVRGEPGWFAVRAGVEVRSGRSLLDPDRPIHFSIVDPDIRGLPLHRTAEFLTVPRHYRYHFLVRNPHCVDALMRCFGAVHDLASRPRTETGLIQAGPEVEKLLNAAGELRDRFGVTPVWAHDGKVLDPPPLFLEPTYPDDLPTLGRTARERLHFRKALADRRRQFGIRAPRRQPDDYYKRLLAVWDAREGWCGEPSRGYDPNRAMKLQAAVTEAGPGSSIKDYYRAFRLVSGLDYSREAWLTTVGIFWLDCNADALRRLGTGRRPGMSAQEDEPVVRFLDLVNRGVNIEEAARSAALSEQETRLLTDPDNREAVLAFMQNPKRVRELLARL